LTYFISNWLFLTTFLFSQNISKKCLMIINKYLLSHVYFCFGLLINHYLDWCFSKANLLCFFLSVFWFGSEEQLIRCHNFDLFGLFAWISPFYKNWFNNTAFHIACLWFDNLCGFQYNQLISCDETTWNNRF